MAYPLLLDTNLTVLLAVGLASENYIAKHKRLSAYDQIDFRIVKRLVARSSGILFTPNVLTETSNLANQIGDPIRSHISRTLSRMIGHSGESYVTSKAAASHQHYARLGLTDVTLLMLAESDATLLTADLHLYLAAAAAGLKSINYNHLRDQRPDFS